MEGPGSGNGLQPQASGSVIYESAEESLAESISTRTSFSGALSPLDARSLSNSAAPTPRLPPEVAEVADTASSPEPAFKVQQKQQQADPDKHTHENGQVEGAEPQAGEEVEQQPWPEAQQYQPELAHAAALAPKQAANAEEHRQEPVKLAPGQLSLSAGTGEPAATPAAPAVAASRRPGDLQQPHEAAALEPQAARGLPGPAAGAPIELAQVETEALRAVTTEAAPPASAPAAGKEQEEHIQEIELPLPQTTDTAVTCPPAAAAAATCAVPVAAAVAADTSAAAPFAVPTAAPAAAAAFMPPAAALHAVAAEAGPSPAPVAPTAATAPEAPQPALAFPAAAAPEVFAAPAALAAASAVAPTPAPAQELEEEITPIELPQPAAEPAVAHTTAASAAPAQPKAAAPAAAAAAGLLAAAGAEPLPPGAGMFSVPPRDAPSTGLYGVPEECFVIKDLDTGKAYNLDKRYWIKDVDTGSVYMLDSDSPAGQPPKVTELFSGQKLSLAEFEDALGFFRVPAPPPPPQHTMVADATSTAQQLAQKGLKGLNLGLTATSSWVKSGIEKLKNSGSPRAGTGAAAGFDAAGQAAMPDDKQGVPVKVQVYRKSYKEFTDLRMVQQLTAHQGVVWAMRFSRNGKYLATAGQDCIIRVWEVSPARLSSNPTTPTSAAGGTVVGEGGSEGGALPAGAAAAASAPAGSFGPAVGQDPASLVFSSRPVRIYRGHKQDVLDLSWSRTQFLLSASMDKTVRLWHISMDECLRVFKHTDFVTAIDFHPSDDKLFLSGSIDGKARLWNIPEQRVVSWQDVHEMVTAVSYSPDGRKAVVGTMKGKCRFYSIDKNSLEYEAQLDVKNKRGQHARGKKITGLTFLPTEPSKLLITSNDSRIRLYDGFSLRCKYKGHANRNTQIRASFSPGGDYLVCGSDDGWVYVWGTHRSEVPATGGTTPRSDGPPQKEKSSSYECFQAHGDVITVAVFAPESCQRDPGSLSPMAAFTLGSASAGSLRHQRSASLVSLDDKADGEAALTSARARGQVLVTAGYEGTIKVYENLGLPQWL